MSRMSIFLTGWLALNVAFLIVMLLRGAYARHRVYRWVVSKPPSQRRHYAHALVEAVHHHH
jgi:hypothetical protein